MGCGRYAVLPELNTAGKRNLGAHLCRRQHTSVPWFGALRKLDLDHFYLRIAGLSGKFLGAELTGCIAAAKITRTDFPNQIPPLLSVVGRNRPLSGVVRKVTETRTPVQGANRVSRECPEAHR